MRAALTPTPAADGQLGEGGGRGRPRRRRGPRPPARRRPATRTSSAVSATAARSSGGSVPTRGRPASAAKRDPARLASVGEPLSTTRRWPSTSRTPGGRRSRRSTMPEHADDRRGVDVAAPALVVEADVAADDRDAEGPARLGHAVDRLGQLPHHLGVLGVAEVEAVDERQRVGPRRTARLSTASATTDAVPWRGVDGAPAVVAVGGEGQAPAGVDAGGGVLEPQHRGVAAGRLDGVEEELVVVLACTPTTCRPASAARAAREVDDRGGLQSSAVTSRARRVGEVGRLGQGPVVAAARRRRATRPGRRRAPRRRGGRARGGDPTS